MRLSGSHLLVNADQEASDDLLTERQYRVFIWRRQLTIEERSASNDVTIPRDAITNREYPIRNHHMVTKCRFPAIVVQGYSGLFSNATSFTTHRTSEAINSVAHKHLMDYVYLLTAFLNDIAESYAIDTISDSLYNDSRENLQRILCHFRTLLNYSMQFDVTR